MKRKGQAFRACTALVALVAATFALQPPQRVYGGHRAPAGQEDTGRETKPPPASRPPTRPADREKALRIKRAREEAVRRRREAAERAREIARRIARDRERRAAAARASEQYESYQPKSRGPVLDCEEKGEQQLRRGELRVPVPANGCTGWFILNPDPKKPTFTRNWRWETAGEVLGEVEDLGGYGTFRDSPSGKVHLDGTRTRGIRFKGLGKPVNVTFSVDIWFVVRLRNDTDQPVAYQIIRDGTWETFSIQPKAEVTHTWIAAACCDIRYDHKYEAGYQEKKQGLQMMKIPDHDPTESDKKKAPLNYFTTVDASGNIQLYTAP